MEAITIEDLVEVVRQAVREEMGRAPLSSPWLNPDQASEYLGTTPGTLKTWRACGEGPKYHVCGGQMIRYLREDLDRYVRTGGR